MTTDMEDRLRKALAEAAAQVDPDSLRPLTAPQPAGRLVPVRARLALAGAAAAGLAVAAVAVPAALTGTTASDQVTPSVPSPRTSVTLDARSFLLAGAERAAGEERAEGAFWYSRVRTFKPQPSGEVVVSSEEVWYDGETGRGRITTGLDAEIILPGESGGAGKAKGTPKPEPETRDFDMRLLTAIGGERLSQDDIRRLPDDVAGLRRWLDAHRAEGESETGFVFAMTRFVLSQPTTPATRAAMLRILADQPGLKLERGITDPLGRPGAAVTSPDGEHRLIVDESGARLLAEEYHGPDRADKRDGRSVHVGARKGEKTVYESSGWTEKIGDRP